VNYGGRKKWEEGKYPESPESPSASPIGLGAEITNHRGNSTVLCFQHSLLGIEAPYEAIQTLY